MTTTVPPRLDPANAVFLPIDYMHGLMSACRSIEPGILRNNAIALAKVAKLFGLPTFGTGDRSGRTYLGAEMTEIEAIIPEMRFINRSSVGAWEAPGYADAVRATGRRQLIMAGITTEQCVAFTAQSALAEGYQVHVVLDASASLDERSEMAAVARLTAMGATVTTWSPLAAELLGDFARPEAMGLIRIYSEHQGSLRMVEDAFNVATAAARSALGAGDNAAREGAYHGR
ncbi:isochorismatase family protein [Falsiroseomonas sp. HW251]|uniref:isochorismatase family protein n=1 Tax=Falsiroseomonas sp. HW251 TaxID=3390998 RepID=UPI003D312ED2